MSQLATIATSPRVPALVSAAGDPASLRFIEFFAGIIRNPHTRRAYGRAVADFLTWCETHGVASIAAVRPLHVATWIELRTRERSAPTVKQQLAALRHLFDWLVTGQVLPTNPAASVRGPSHVVRVGRTPALAPAEARALLDGIDASTPIGLRDRRGHGCHTCRGPGRGADRAKARKIVTLLTQPQSLNRSSRVTGRRRGGAEAARRPWGGLGMLVSQGVVPSRLCVRWPHRLAFNRWQGHSTAQP